MLPLVERNLLTAGSRLLGRRFVALDSATTARPGGPEGFVDKNENYDRLRSENDKSLRVAIIGLPNVGKSTLINRLINRPVCAMASRVHLTRAKADAIYSNDDTQLVFIDTPGLVSAHEFKMFNMEESFRSDAEEAMASADVVGVVQDASNKYTRGTIHHRIVELMEMTRAGATSVLIMNKIDLMKRKRELLSLVRALTSEKGWPNFSDVFMVSSLTNDGIHDLRNYLLDSAKNRDWEYPGHVVTNQPPERIVECAVRSKLMDSLLQEIPYELKVKIEHMGTCEDGSLSCFVTVICDSQRILKIVMGARGERIKLVAIESEEELSKAFRTPVRVKISVKSDDRDDRSSTHRPRK